MFQEQQEAELRQALALARKAEREASTGHVKRKPNEFLARYLNTPTASIHAIRPEESYQARTYNRARQVLGLIDHVFVQYRVPLFLYRAILSWEGLDLIFGCEGEVRRSILPEAKYLDWFLAAAQGGSLADVAKGVLTRKEAHWFLQGPNGNNFDQAILWAKAAAAGLPRAGRDYVAHRLDPITVLRLGDRLPDLLRIYAESWDAMRPDDRDEITDFVRDAALDATFSFKGRTFGSLRKLSNEWHRLTHGVVLGEYKSWSPILPLWEMKEKGVHVRALELSSNRALADEGRRQHHCVYSYTSRCLQGMSRIVSIRWYAPPASHRSAAREVERLTLEVSPQRRVVQIRGRLNRPVTTEELQIVRKWAGEQGVRLPARQ